MNIITREEAKLKGLKLFFDGKPCKRGHIAERYTLRGYCKTCAVDLATKYKLTDKYTKYKKKYLASLKAKRIKNNKNPRACLVGLSVEEKKARKRELKSVSSYMRNYNISKEEAVDIFNRRSNSVCEICNTVPPIQKTQGGNLKPRLVLDHCHDTGKIRGLLCNNCNWGLGHFSDDVDKLNLAIKYLNKHK